MTTEQILQTLQAAHPKTHISDATLAVYAADLDDLDEEDLERAVTELRRTLRFFPTIAEIREAAAANTLNAPDPAEAFRQASTGRAEHWLVTEARDRVGDGWHWRTSTAADLERQFRNAYGEARDAALRELQVGSGRAWITKP